MKKISVCFLCFVLSVLFCVGANSGHSCEPPERILWVSPEMRLFIEQYDHQGVPTERLMNRLLADLLSDEGLGFTYDNRITATASVAFEEKRGNCLSFAYLFTALSRELGFRTKFNRVSVISNFETKKELVVETGHINVLVYIFDEIFVVDPRPDYQNILYDDKKLIHDDSAYAAYYNNLAVDRMVEGKPDLARELFQEALDLQRNCASILRNVGLFKKMEGSFQESEELLLKSAKYSENKSVIYFIINKFYEEIGDKKKAKKYLRKAKYHRNKNPFYFHSEALKFIENEDYQSAIKSLEKAIKLARTCHYFYHDLAKVYERTGEHKEMMTMMDLAIKHASTDAIKTDYANERKKLIEQYEIESD